MISPEASLSSRSSACAAAHRQNSSANAQLLCRSGSRTLLARAAELGEQRLALCARGVDALRLEVAEAADLLGQRGDLHGQGVVVGREALEQRADGLLVLGDQRALHAPLGGMAEEVK